MLWAAWVANGLAAVAIIVAWRSSRRSTDASAKVDAAADTADEARRATVAMAESLEQIASSITSPVAPAVELPAFKLEPAEGAEYRLRNVSPHVAATSVRVDIPEEYQVYGAPALPGIVDLRPMESTLVYFVAEPYDEVPRLGEIEVWCNERDGPIVVPVP